MRFKILRIRWNDESRPGIPSISAMRTIVCDLRGVAADCVTVDALARFHLAAKRAGVELRLRHASAELNELLVLTGLNEVLAVEAGRETEEREERVGAEEERQLDDLPT
jgi:anti-anti-sigma regulatory factor